MSKPSPSSSSPLSSALVTVFGGGGFIGNYVVQALLERGARVRVASRKPEKSWPLKPLANLGQLTFARCDITKPEQITKALSGAEYVVNLVGAFDGDLGTLMGEAPGQMAAQAKANGVKGFVHMSAIGADENSPTAYAKGKGMGERLVKQGFENATILRPSIVFGKDDNFLNMFGGLIQMAPVLPVFGPDAQLQLVYVDDVAEAVAVALENPAKHGGKTFELGGPEVLTMMDINTRIAAACGRDPKFIAMPDGLSGLFAAMPLTPMSRDQWTLLKAGSVVADDANTLADLGIDARPLGLFLDKWMTRYRKFGRFGLANERNKSRTTKS
ncbi:3-beta hydroxysteroid dehydrogenase [Erythrobacter longus]|uniref:3-beta hydroxysteroid dehydrogenase n=1 Tax=Erythrobacter longus TaxID=1044 RepID=A0A074M8M5_ERYLO|nr:complex I NDUFA9 subunit family protein [Erythrobacter longus]KEO89774.1 3-beta hydroxysteroid dehydrogenase [Erythrobacter longus]